MTRPFKLTLPLGGGGSSPSSSRFVCIGPPLIEVGTSAKFSMWAGATNASAVSSYSHVSRFLNWWSAALMALTSSLCVPYPEEICGYVTPVALRSLYDLRHLGRRLSGIASVRPSPRNVRLAANRPDQSSSPQGNEQPKPSLAPEGSWRCREWFPAATASSSVKQRRPRTPVPVLHKRLIQNNKLIAWRGPHRR